MPDLEDEIREVKKKLFGSGSNGIPRSYVEMAHKAEVTTKPYLAINDYAKGEFCVYWLDGQLFRCLTWSGTENNASACELAYPLSTLRSVNTEYSLEYDDFTRRHSRWDRRVTLHFRDQEPIALEIRAEERQDTQASRLADAVLGALAGR